MRFGPLSRRTILQTALAAWIALTIPALTIAQGKGGGGKGGGGDDGGDSTPPPVTYMITWIEGFSAYHSNEAGDLEGSALNDSVGEEALYYEGNTYLLNDLLSESGATLRFLNGLSDRTSTGGVYLCGSCDRNNEIQGFRLLVEPNSIGQLERSEIVFVAPPEGKDAVRLDFVNSAGEAVGVARDPSGGPLTGMYLAADGTTSNFADDLGGVTNMGLTEIGVRVFRDATTRTVYCDTPGSSAIPLLNEVEQVRDVNEMISMVGRLERIETSKNKTQLVDYEFVLTDQLYDEQVPDYRRVFSGINDFNDVLVSLTFEGKRNEPSTGTMSIIFGDTGSEYRIDDMLDSANSDADLLRYFSSFTSGLDVKNSGVIYGSARSTDGSHAGATIVLTPAGSP